MGELEGQVVVITGASAGIGEATARMIAVFKGLGLRAGNALAILASNRAEVLPAMLAANLMGMRYTPLHPMASADDLAHIIADAEIDVLIVEAEKFTERGKTIRDGAIAPWNAPTYAHEPIFESPPQCFAVDAAELGDHPTHRLTATIGFRGAVDQHAPLQAPSAPPETHTIWQPATLSHASR